MTESGKVSGQMEEKKVHGNKVDECNDSSASESVSAAGSESADRASADSASSGRASAGNESVDRTPADNESSGDTKAARDNMLPQSSAFGGGLTSVLHSGFGITSPFTREIYLGEQVIVGMRFQGGSDQLVATLKPGCKVTFMREPENRFDPKAIMALDEQGRKLGYIPRHDNTILAALMDAGKYLYGTMTQKSLNMDYYRGGTPPVLSVDLYMREFSMPGDPDQIPRQGYRGSYVVMALTVTKDNKDDPKITDVCAIRVINGEERGIYMGGISQMNGTGYRFDEDENSHDADWKERIHESDESERIHDADERDQVHDGAEDNQMQESSRDESGTFADYEKVARELQEFTGYLPVVIYDPFGDKKTALENAWGVFCGRPFSNLVINVFEMAYNHLNDLHEYSLETVADRLGISADCGSEQENCCRVVWRIYYRFDRSELEKRKETISRG